MTVALVCIGLLGALVFALGLTVSLLRANTKQGVGLPDDDTSLLYKAIRAHGNAAEYAALLAVLIFVLGSQGPTTWQLWLMGGAVGARYLHAAGMLLSKTLNAPHPLRWVGSAGTYACGIALSIRVLLA